MASLGTAARRLSATSGRHLDVGIVGLGTAGAAAAIFLARQGHRVKLFEKTPESQLHGAGAGIGVQPIGLTVLKHLGILEPILAHGRRIDRLHATTETGRTVLDLAYADYRPELYGVGLHRDVLFRELHEAAQAEPNIEIEYGFDAAGLDVAGAGAAQNAIRGADGGAAGPFDLLVAADGRSSIRSTTSARAYERWYPYGCLWAILPDADGAFTSEGLLQQKLSAGSAREMLGFLPCGRTHNSDEQLVSLFWSLDMATLDAVREAGFEAWGARVVELEPKAAGLVDELRRRGGLDALIPAAYSDTWMPAYHHGESCVFLGDAAHACSPQLGQGANLALVDAWTLAESVAACGADAPAAVRHYDAAALLPAQLSHADARLPERLGGGRDGERRLHGAALLLPAEPAADAHNACRRAEQWGPVDDDSGGGVYGVYAVAAAFLKIYVTICSQRAPGARTGVTRSWATSGCVRLRARPGRAGVAS